MDIPLGILFAVVAMICWGFGDFFIQKSLRKVGDWETLFIITLLGSIILLPFVWVDIVPFLQSHITTLAILFGAGLILLLAALLEFESLKIGKISVIEPIWSLEIPSAVLFAFIVLNESMDIYQIITIAVLIIGLFMVSYKGSPFSKKFLLERGIILSAVAAVVMGLANFFVGWGARTTDPLLASFIINIVCVIASGSFLVWRGKMGQVVSDIKTYPGLLLKMAILDNIAWIAFAFAMIFAPIGIAAALSESYIIIAVLLGIFINKEKIELHQKIGLAVAIIAMIILAVLI
ncbi:MAG: DMT family transporter [Candidatus Pacebacteria bacterium]|jgi:drug/metabolite transporter (DMT)-like permease|nr:DMT family transporter [Candidatus Paceibacterota bacterium]